ncbi:MAG: transposase [Kiritimatiellae bacterium]|nr:transposase [Kiritimatiellia bacterium]
MARKLRVQYPGAIYHVLSRGDRREAIFLDDGDRDGFLIAVGEVCEKSGWEVHALCLMDNHFHLVVETPQGNLSNEDEVVCWVPIRCASTADIGDQVLCLPGAIKPWWLTAQVTVFPNGL